MNEITLAIFGLFIVAGIIVLIIARKDNKIKKLESEKRSLISAINFSAKIIGESNVLGVPPKELPKEFEDK
jgi:hypothetical protein